MPSSAPRSAEDQEALESTLTQLFEEKISFNKYLGFRIERLNPSDARIRFDMRPELVGHYYYGRLHGGVISSVLDATAGLAVMWAMCEKHESDTAEQMMQRFTRLGTIDLRVDYLEQGKGKHFVSSSNVLRLGGRVAFTQMQLHNDEGLLIASGAGSYVVS